ncbi:NAD glycohydrolase toxin immunity factor [Streptococcus phocae]|uniref:NAD glycohydrolase inhibitor n=1 Tax=Streptococcus phocae TaxID=119224 RepID=A0A0P6S2J1_9STRE|nr:NAD glycohydrolase toxin immunity factor [Streptococcus phocae]KPJ22778.1 NAD glycohydrolase inhibitor [Streptococcus phocae]
MYQTPSGYDEYKQLFNQDLQPSELVPYFIGDTEFYRINNRDSFMSDISDAEVILEYGIYPAFLNGKTQIKENVEKALVEMSLSKQPLCVYQAVQFLNAENMLRQYYETVPFTLEQKEILANIKASLQTDEMKNDMTHYKVGEFANYQDSMLDMVERIILTF